MPAEQYDFEIQCLGGIHAERIAPISKELIDSFRKIIDRQANHYFQINASMFLSVGMEIDDVKSLCNCYLSSFLSTQGICLEGPHRQKFIEDFYVKNGPFVDPDEDQYVDADKAIFTMFLKQRLQSLIKVVNVKRKEMHGFYSREIFYLVDKKSTMKDTKVLDWMSKIQTEQLGFYKVYGKKVDQIKKTIKNIPPNSFFNFEGNVYFKHLKVSSSDPKIFYKKENQEEFENLKNRFNNLSETKRLDLIKKFIKKNKKRPSKLEQIEIAKQLIITGTLE